MGKYSSKVADDAIKKRNALICRQRVQGGRTIESLMREHKLHQNTILDILHKGGIWQRARRKMKEAENE